jgi:hypothetical protein
VTRDSDVITVMNQETFSYIYLHYANISYQGHDTALAYSHYTVADKCESNTTVLITFRVRLAQSV